MTEIHLRALDGSNPLAFLSAVGTLRGSTGAFGTAVKMDWVRDRFWYPRLQFLGVVTPEELVRELSSWLADRASDFRISDDKAGMQYKDLTIPRELFRSLVMASVTSERLEVLAALGTDATAEANIEDTALRTMSGAGHQHYLESIEKLADLTTSEDLRRALFEPWKYDDQLPYLRLDPRDDRRYALRWQDPSRQSKGFEIRTVRGANRLAVEGMRVFPVIPCRQQDATTGFRRIARVVSWTWPIWHGMISLDSVRSLVAIRELQEESLVHRKVIRAMGVVEVFRSRRITIGKVRNFTPARAV